ncbi:hypothetical protein P154DRAFT_446921 [Amniculicola lignicola CBS 123094]|uniref:Copper acquisition factor BIM1-like domain-containing protein n=1 Tax=Amniculicola lignicola CBS 123094 TaxID=1392246 RepID=A0A6A5VZ01_9PLEO|nr:hypothetical protein P154DRAFT_446921 [Amniculicola lignicola CBS 123094]
MLFNLLSTSVLLWSLSRADDPPKHGEGAEGSSMGPVAFMWPSDRAWTAANDNTGPCGSPSGPTNRSAFPLSQGEVALSIADEAWHVAFRLAVSNNPTQQSDFDDQVVDNITELEPGHQCYKLQQLENISAGQNATIQLEYWSDFEGENNGNNQSFFACADVYFVETMNFKDQVPCFNVTSADFNSPNASSTPSASASSTSAGLSSATSGAPAAASPSASSSSGGLSTGAKAGIAVGSVIGGLAILALIAFLVFRRGKNAGLQNRNSYELRAKTLSTTPEAGSTNTGT